MTQEFTITPDESTVTAWRRNAAALAEWTESCMVNRHDAFGHYLPFAAREPKKTAITDKSGLTVAVLRKHFEGRDQGDLVGLHSTVRDEAAGEGEIPACWSKWLAADVDCHGDGTDPESTREAALAWFARLRHLGFLPLLFDSDGRGGFHLLTIFDGPVPTERVFRFGKWLIHDWQSFGIPDEPEVFPKQANLGRGKGFGNWLRLPGRHHTRDHWTRAWDGSQRQWCDGQGAINLILASKGTPATKIPDSAIDAFEAGATREVHDPSEGLSEVELARSALESLRQLAANYDDWIRVGMCLRGLGSDGLALWDGWSQSSPDKYERGACAEKWETFEPGNGTGLNLGTLFYLAGRSGWKRPAGRVVQAQPGVNGHGAPPEDTAGNGDEGGAQEPPPNETADDPHRLARLFLGLPPVHPEGPTLRYWNEEWHRWDGLAWRCSPDREIAAELTDFVKREFNRVALGTGGYCRQVTTKTIGNAIQALRGLCLLKTKDCRSQPTWLPPFTTGEDLPDPREILPATNGLVHLPSYLEGDTRSRPLTPRFFSPTSLGYAFNPHGGEPAAFLAFLRSLWPDDPESIEALQEWFGYLLVPDTSQQKILMVIGPKRSGKGTITRVLRGVVGEENVTAPTLSGLATNFGLAPLIGKPVAIIADARLSGRSDSQIIVERLLSISGEDAQTIDRKHREAWTGKLPTRIVLVSNELPRLGDSSGALPSRMILLRLTRSFLGEEDTALTAKLMVERPAILRWAIHGWARFRERGRFQQPRSGTELLDDLADLASPISAFIEERCDLGPECRATVKDLFGAWKSYCSDKGKDRTGDEQGFGKNLRAAIPGLRMKRTGSYGGPRVREYDGISLKSSF